MRSTSSTPIRLSKHVLVVRCSCRLTSEKKRVNRPRRSHDMCVYLRCRPTRRERQSSRIPCREQTRRDRPDCFVFACRILLFNIENNRSNKNNEARKRKTNKSRKNLKQTNRKRTNTRKKPNEIQRTSERFHSAVEQLQIKK
jgi:hypothetical protein